MQDGWEDEVLRFWFAELAPEDWWRATPAIDQRVRRFETLHKEVAAASPDELTGSARQALAAVLALDQFPRNMFRGSVEAFSTDSHALAVTRAAMAKGLDADLDASGKQFLYMPLMHSENVEDLRHCVDLFATLGNEESAKAAREHHEIVATFGRYPHRNRALGRPNTEAEAAFLAGHKGFGQ